MDLKVARQIARLTQRQLAQRAGVDEATISLLERGERDYRQAGYQAVTRLALALNVEPQLLFPVDEPEDKPERVASK